MGRHLLLTGIALAITLAGCTEDPAASTRAGSADSSATASAARQDAHASVAAGTPMSDGVHAGLPCARCHDGAAIDRTIPAASDDACLDCHEADGAGTVALGTIEMEHYAHGGDDAIAAGCASCHVHETGELDLSVTTTGCSLCHAESLDGSKPEGCRLCHTDPGHVALTSQNVPVLHSELPWIGGECVRCHFDVGRPATTVAASTCVDCHRNAAAVTELGAGRDLHPSHTGVTCGGCHEDVSHHIVAMSSGVELSCTQCHATAHDIRPGDVFAASTCNACHTAAHAAEQRLMLGVAPAGVAATPGDKFLVGLTCRSCHVQTADAAGTRTSCVGCHSTEYATVLTWWERGSAQRVDQTAQYVAAARAAAGSDSARVLAAAADSLVAFVRQGGPAHNLPLSHRALEEALVRAAAVWTAAGTTAPAPPDLGRTPRMGQCTYCHYEWREPRFQLDMPDAFHRRVMSRGESAARAADPRTP